MFAAYRLFLANLYLARVIYPMDNKISAGFVLPNLIEINKMIVI